MNDNKRVTSVTVRTVHQSDFTVSEGQTDLGQRGVVVDEDETRNFIPFSNVASIEYHLEEVEDEEEEFDPEEKQGVEGEGEAVTEIEGELTVKGSFSQSIDEDSLEEDYTVDELSNVILPHIEDSAVLNDAIEVDGRSTAVDEYEDRLEDLRDEGQ